MGPFDVTTQEKHQSATLAVVCHDAGATNLILPWLREWKGPLQPYMTGPAAELWRKAFPARPVCHSLEEALKGATRLVSGTGWSSHTEHDARRLAAKQGLHSVAVIDHWVNYSPRFERSGVQQLPDEVWVADEEAEALAKLTFPNLPVSCYKNLYLAEQIQKIGAPPGLGHVLYVLEPVRDDWGQGRAGEFQALDFTLAHLARIAGTETPTLILRPHPSEEAGKYQSYLTRYPFVRLDASADMAAAISQADVVVGVESFALTIALQANRPTYSSLPPWGPAIRLPHKGIVQIRKILDDKTKTT